MTKKKVDAAVESKSAAARATLAAVELPAPDDKDSDAKWKVLAKALLPTYRDAAAGLIELEPTQRQILQSIMDRAFGKPGQKKDAAPATGGVVVLPMLGVGAKANVCSDCLTFHQNGHDPTA